MFLLNIIGLNGSLVRKKIQQIECPTQGEQIGILKGHAPTVAILSAGDLVIHMTNTQKKIISITGGYMRVDEDGCTIMVQDDSTSIKEQIRGWN